MKKTTTFIKEAIKINEALKRLQKRAEKLANDIYDNASDEDYEFNVDGIKDLMNTLNDLANFDLEDSINM